MAGTYARPRAAPPGIAGAALLGAGAVVAMGCTVGPGLSAFALLSCGAPVTAAAIFLGAAIGLRQLITGLAPQVRAGGARVRRRDTGRRRPG